MLHQPPEPGPDDDGVALAPGHVGHGLLDGGKVRTRRGKSSTRSVCALAVGAGRWSRLSNANSIGVLGLPQKGPNEVEGISRM